MTDKRNEKPTGSGPRVPRWIWGLVVMAMAIGVYTLRPAAKGDGAALSAAESETAAPLPRLVDLGADKCVPCKMMAPVLEELRVEYAAHFTVEFIDVWKSPAAGKPYGIKIIPTQIFFAADGTELFRHEGFFSREDILAKWREFGVDI